MSRPIAEGRYHDPCSPHTINPANLPPALHRRPRPMVTVWLLASGTAGSKVGLGTGVSEYRYPARAATSQCRSTKGSIHLYSVPTMNVRVSSQFRGTGITVPLLK